MLVKFLSPIACTVAIAFASAVDCAAQVTQLPRTGCPNSAYPKTSGPARIGQPFSVSCPPCTGTARQFTMLGTRLNRVFAIQPPLGCTPAGTVCVLACDPLDVVNGGTWSIQVPLDRGLVGACVCVQCSCFDVNASCFGLSGALEVCVEP